MLISYRLSNARATPARASVLCGAAQRLPVRGADRQPVATAAAASRSGHALQPRRGPRCWWGSIHAPAAGLTRRVLTPAGIALAALVIAVITIRVRREDMEQAHS